MFQDARSSENTYTVASGGGPAVSPRTVPSTAEKRDVNITCTGCRVGLRTPSGHR